MGAFDAVPHILVPDDERDPAAAKAFRSKYGWEPHEQVILRGTFTAGMQETVSNASVISDKKGKMQMLGGTGRIKLLECMIVDWTFSSNGHKVPINAETIKRLPSRYCLPLLEKCDELAASIMDEEEQDDFFGSANDPSQANYIEGSLSHLQ
jgi:hypothetical protein